MLDDGAYDVHVIDASDVDGAAQGDVRVEVTITSAANRGAVVVLHGRVEGASALDLLGTPATLVIRDGVPALLLDDAGGASMTPHGEG